MASRSIVEYFAEHEHYRCGYCGATDTNSSHGMWAHAMTVQDYQDLIDRGWRRSGMYCYKPTMKVTCCPQYPIRCDVGNFKLSHSQKKVIKKVNRYLIKGLKSGDSGVQEGVNDMPVQQGGTSDSEGLGLRKVHTDVKKDTSQIHQSKESKAEAIQSTKNPTPGAISVNVIIKIKMYLFICLEGTGADPNKPPCRKAKELRKEKKMKKLQMKKQDSANLDQTTNSDTCETRNTEATSLEDLLSEPDRAENCAHKLEIKLVRSNPRSTEFDETFKASHSVYHKYQMQIHNDPPDKPKVKQFTRFLVDSPLQSKHTGGLLPMGYGSFHQQYILDGKIIAVGVIDILSNSTSSVYLYYDPAYSFLSLGTYSSLREIEFTRSLKRLDSNILYYYMGFYIHSCPKMRYKGHYFPSFLTCPEVYSWHSMEECKPKLDKNKYSRFAEDGKEDPNGNIVLNNVLVLHGREPMRYQVYRIFNPSAEDQDEVQQYAQFVGRECAERMLLFRK
ncbi:hypothetical protein ScPMuIL_013147 [Solemya velum]